MRMHDCIRAMIVTALAFTCFACASSGTGSKSVADPGEPVAVAKADAGTPGNAGSGLEYNENLMSDLEDEGEDVAAIPDPLEPMNRFFFGVNDLLYTFVIRPAATGYSLVVPEPVRGSISNFFYNLRYPIRLVSCLLQGKGEKAWLETQRFIVNTTSGLGGFIDLAGDTDPKFKLSPEDLGQTFGYWGADHGFYLVLPLFGPSSLRDGIGEVGDYFLDPLSWYDPSEHGIAIKAEDKLNKESLRLGDYEDLKKASIDPYTAIKDIYTQYREGLVQDKSDAKAPPTP